MAKNPLPILKKKHVFCLVCNDLIDNNPGDKYGYCFDCWNELHENMFNDLDPEDNIDLYRHHWL